MTTVEIWTMEIVREDGTLLWQIQFPNNTTPSVPDSLISELRGSYRFQVLNTQGEIVYAEDHLV